MKIQGNDFALTSKLNVLLNSEDNDGLIFIPKNVTLFLEIENYFGKIIINNLKIEKNQDEFSLTKKGLESSTASLDIKLLDRYIYKILSDKSGIGHSPYKFFMHHDFTSFEKSRRLTDLDWAMFASLYVFACNALPKLLSYLSYVYPLSFSLYISVSFSMSLSVQITLANCQECI